LTIACMWWWLLAELASTAYFLHTINATTYSMGILINNTTYSMTSYQYEVPHPLLNSSAIDGSLFGSWIERINLKVISSKIILERENNMLEVRQVILEALDVIPSQAGIGHSLRLGPRSYFMLAYSEMYAFSPCPPYRNRQLTASLFICDDMIYFTAGTSTIYPTMSYCNRSASLRRTSTSSVPCDRWE